MHSIRLRGPWQLEPLNRFVRRADGCYERSPAPLLSVRTTVPSDWAASLGDDFLGCVCYHRTFQKPTGLGSGERVFLVVEPPRSQCVVTLNDYHFGALLPGSSVERFDITEYLYPHNQLDILVDHPAIDNAGRAIGGDDVNLPGGLIGEVRLEIEER